MNNRFIFLTTIFFMTSSSVNAEWSPMPGGGGCVIQNGCIVSCSGMESDEVKIEREREKTKRQRMKMLEDCLRKTDWPGMPSRSECNSMYGE